MVVERRRGCRSGISVMFMTFIAVSILSLVFATYYLYLTRHNLSASEAQRIYAESSQERVEAFFYPPAGEALQQGIRQRLVIRNAGTGATIKYLFAFGVQETPLNSREIGLRSGETYVMDLERTIPGGGEIRIVTERGSVFVAREGYFSTSLNPRRVRLTLPEDKIANVMLIVVSNNYEARMRITLDARCRIEAGFSAEFSLTRNGVHAVPIECGPITSPGSFSYSIMVEDAGTGYRKTETLTVNAVERGAAASIPFSYVVIEEITPRSVSGNVGDRRSVNIRVRGYNNYYGTITFGIYDPAIVLGPSSFNPTPVTLTPIIPEAVVTLTFTIRGSGRVWIRIYEGPSGNPTTRDVDYFDVVIT